MTSLLPKNDDTKLLIWRGKGHLFEGIPLAIQALVHLRAALKHLQKHFKQFTAYSRKAYPFTTPLGQDQDPLDWWKAFEGTANGGILVAIAIKLYLAVPHSMAEEQTMSGVVTMLNSTQRNRRKVETLISMAQIRAFYKQEAKVCKSFRPHPVLECLFITIDDETRDTANDDDLADDDESDSEADSSKKSAHRHNEAQEPEIPTSKMLPCDDEDDEYNLKMSSALEELLADAPLKRSKSNTMVP